MKMYVIIHSKLEIILDIILNISMMDAKKSLVYDYPFMNKTENATFFKGVGGNLVKTFNGELKSGILYHIISYTDAIPNAKVCKVFYYFVNLIKEGEVRKLENDKVIDHFLKKPFLKRDFLEPKMRILKDFRWMSSQLRNIKKKLSVKYGKGSFSADKIKELFYKNLIFKLFAYFCASHAKSMTEISFNPKAPSISLQDFDIELEEEDLKVVEGLIRDREKISNYTNRLIDDKYNKSKFENGKSDYYGMMPSMVKDLKLELENLEKNYFERYWNLIEKVCKKLKKENKYEEVCRKIAEKAAARFKNLKN